MKNIDDSQIIRIHIFYASEPLSKNDLQTIPYGQFRSYTCQTVMLLNMFLDQVGIYDANLIQIEQQMKEESQISSATYQYWSKEIISAVQSYGINSSTFVTQNRKLLWFCLWTILLLWARSEG